MAKFIQKYLSFLISIVLYFNFSGHTFCYGSESNYLKNELMNPPNYVGQLAFYIFNVKQFGAKGNGFTDDSKAFQAAFQAACKVRGGVMLVPSGTFLLQPITFYGNNCQRYFTWQVYGLIVAPPNISGWKGISYHYQWILFSGFSKGITIQGNGVVDGRGNAWWGKSRNPPHVKHLENHLISPTSKKTLNNPFIAIRIAKSYKVTVRGIKIQNSPRMHIFLDECQQVTISGLTILAPQESPNTDGIHISHTQHVEIYNSTIGTGDDCIGILTESSDVRIHDVHCGPGHGYSIGGLGLNNQEAHVTNVHVYDSTVAYTLTGVRIKTWPGGSGYVNNITFSHITMTNVKTPIVIDQNYCNGKKGCTWTSKNAVAISGVTFENIIGTYSYQPASLVCSVYKPCTNILMGTINLTPSGRSGSPICQNAYGRVLTNTTPSLKNCLK
ncbi:hypothetical protein ACJIZ3_015072 [Penstemon smallii]|uniref:Polygalacturonase n=1 Tax=Penstemon smallii TaxID=265156 RepID=A0ABD3RLF6_9LAMI